jgi:hypothetical protein
MIIDVSEMRTASIIRVMITLMIEVVRTSETSLDSNKTTRHYIPQGSHFIPAAVRT